MGALKHVAVYRDFVFAQHRRRRPRLRALLRRGAARHRQPGRPLAGGPAAHRRRRAAQHHPLQLEDVPGEHQRHGAPDVDARVGHAGGQRAVAGPARPTRPSRWRWSRSCRSAPATTSSTDGRARVPQRPQRARHRTSASTPATRSCPTTRRRCAQAHGEERATEILQRSPQNSVLFPSLSVKGSPQAIRVIRPLAANRTLVEAWSFRADGAPDLLFERAMTYNRLVFSPMSMVAHDDVHLFESIQQGLARRRQRMGEPASRLRARRAGAGHERRSTAPTSC